MTDEPESNLQNQVETPKRGNNPTGKGGLKKGYDPRRWLKGRGPKSPEQREGEEILRTVIWEELSREFDTSTMKPLEQSETIDTMRLMVRSWIKTRPDLIAERIAGKVLEKHNITGETKQRIEIVYVDSDPTDTNAPLAQGTDAGQAGTEAA